MGMVDYIFYAVLVYLILAGGLLNSFTLRF